MENIAINARKNITMDKYFSQVKVVTPNNITKIFSVNAKSVVSTTELVNNYLLVSGKVIVNVVYLSDENIIENTESTVEFVEKQKVNFVVSDLVATDEVFVDDVNYSTSEVVCSVLHKTQVVGIYRYFVGDASKTEEDFVVNRKTVSCLNFVSSNEETFVVAEEIESNLSDIKFLSSNASVYLASVSTTVDKSIIEGKIKFQALYSDENGLGEIVKEFEFKQEIAMKNAVPGMIGEAVVRMVNANVTEQNGDKPSLAFVFDVYAKAFLFENNLVETYDDLFSLSKEIMPVYDFLELQENDGSSFENDTILNQTDISKYGDFDDLVGVYFPEIKILSIEDLGDKAVIMSSVQAVAIYKTTENISKIDLNFENKFEIEKDQNKKLENVFATINVSSFKVKAGKDLETTFMVEYKLDYAKNNNYQYLKTFDVKQEKLCDDSAVKVYVLKEPKSIFDVAKALNVKPEIILLQNEVGDYFEAGQKVYVYNPLNLN